jgi:nucleoside-diphosphate-sugar epimerase
MNSLVIGNTSQLSYYFPKEYERISSYNVDFRKFRKNFYDRIFLCLGEQRTFIENNEEMFIKTNVDYTLNIINELSKSCNKIIIYSTAELWNNYEGGIDLSMPFTYIYSPYIKSKEQMSLEIIKHRNMHPMNVIILYPFNFNSIYRTYQYIDEKFTIRGEQKFLFSKIFESIINKKHIQIGDTYFYRDIIHPKYVAERSILADEDEIVGSGRLIFVNDFIRDLYKHNNLEYNEYVSENYSNNLKLKRSIYYLNSKDIKYNNLLKDTLDDIKFIQDKISQ